MVAIELAFFRNAFKSFSDTLDAVLEVVPIRRKQPYNPIAPRPVTAPGHTRSEEYCLADLILMRLQNHLPVL
jgi:hypothetical protein